MANRNCSKIVPTMRGSRAFGGPEFFGCCNSGARPVIKWFTLGSDRVIVVGPESQVREVLADNASCRWVVAGGPRPKWHKTRGVTVRKFKTRAEVRSASAIVRNARSPDELMAGVMVLSAAGVA